MTDPRLTAAILRTDFFSFVQAIFPIVSPNSPLVLNWHLKSYSPRTDACFPWRNSTAHHYCAASQFEINYVFDCVSCICTWPQSKTSLYLREL